jgi:hypothetical protein
MLAGCGLESKKLATSSLPNFLEDTLKYSEKHQGILINAALLALKGDKLDNLN